MGYRFRHHVLSNGLTVVAEIDPGAHSSACGFYVKTGARDEETPDMGVSHFLEHMMFKGTREISAEELNRRFDEIGARNNAFTSNEMTCFYAHVLPEYLGECTDLLGTMMRPALNQSDFDTEKEVILEEIAMYEDNPFFVLYEAAIEKHFGDHPLSHRVLGTTESIRKLERDRMKRYFDRRYGPGNTVVALAGNLDFEHQCDRIERVCAGWTPSGVGRDNSPVRTVGGRFRKFSPKVGRAYILAMCDGPGMDDERRYAASLLAQILGCPDNSRLHWALVEPGIADEAQASCDAHDGYGEFFVFASTAPERADETWNTIQKELDSFRDSLCEDDLKRLQNKIITGATVGGERPADRMHRLGKLWTYLRAYRSLEEELDRLARITVNDLKDAYDAFPLRPQTVASLMPSPGKGVNGAVVEPV